MPTEISLAFRVGDWLQEQSLPITVFNSSIRVICLSLDTKDTAFFVTRQQFFTLFAIIFTFHIEVDYYILNVIEDCLRIR